MKKLTGTSLALTLAMSFGATSAMAGSFEDKDMAFAFDSGNTMEVATLSDQEMKNTEGAWFNFVSAGWGAVGGGVGYASSTFAGGSNWSWPAFAGSVAGGAVGGFFVNPALGATVGAGVGGAISGLSSRW